MDTSAPAKTDQRAPDCPKCAGPTTLGKRHSDGKKFWSCSRWPLCDATVGAHPDGRPMGPAAPPRIRHLRRRCHELAELMWPWASAAARSAFYLWLRETTGLPAERAHVGMLTEPELQGLHRLLILELEKRMGSKN